MPRNRRGTVLVMFALFSAALLTFVGMVAQLGMLYAERTHMQVAADAAALAGARALPEGNQAAIDAAVAYAAKNGSTIAGSDVSIPDGQHLSVAWSQPADLAMAGLLHLDNARVAVSSEAELVVVSRIAGTRPWGVPQQAFVPGGEYILKQAAHGSTVGNFQALAIDGPGAATYEQSIVEGSQTTVHVGDAVATEPGDMVGPTITGVNQLIGYDQTSYEQAIANPDSTPRVVTIPLLTRASWDAVNGRSEVVVAAFARFYLTYTDSMGEVDGRFIDELSSDTVAGAATNYSVKLVG